MTLVAVTIDPSPAADCDAEAARRPGESTRAHVRRAQLAHDLRALPTPRRAVVVLHAQGGVRLTLCLALAAAGIETHGAATSSEARALIDTHDPGVVVAHYFLSPQETALPVLTDVGPRRAAIVVSADASPTLRTIAARLGAVVERTPMDDTETTAFVERVKALLGDSP